MGSCHIAQGVQLGALWWPRGVDGQEGGDNGWEVQEGEDIHIADSLHCTAETNTTL